MHRFFKPILAILFFSLFHTVAMGQRTIKGFVADSSSGKPLSFATVQSDDGMFAVITGISGEYAITFPDVINGLRYSHTGYAAKLVPIDSLKDGDTVFMQPSSGELGEVIVRNDDARIKRLVNTAIRNRNQHNPDKYDAYFCNVYYAMKADLLGMKPEVVDSSKIKNMAKAREWAKIRAADSAKKKELDFFKGNKHMLFTETFSVRQYQRPSQLHERVIASRFSGLKHSYFTNVVTDILPFHLYNDHITLNSKDYVNPIAGGWLNRYKFTLDKEILLGGDTIFQLSFAPRNQSFNALQGTVFLNSDGYAISHFAASTVDTARGREIRIEHVYTKTKGRWFPRELNYTFSIRGLFQPGAELMWNGHSLIDSVHFNDKFPYSFDKARPILMTDSVDLHTTEQWNRFRGDTLTAKEANTYRFNDSISNKYHLEDVMRVSSELAVGRLPWGIFNFDISRVLASNKFEGTRLGLGIYTNDRLSKYFNTGGWFGYGFKDEAWKGGYTFTVYPAGNKEHWIEAKYNNSYRNPGQIYLHPGLSRSGLRVWILGLADRYKEYTIAGMTRTGYWEWRAEASKITVTPLYENAFLDNGKYLKEYSGYEGSIGLRYAYAEKRIPAFGYYMPSETKYPIVYAKFSQGRISSGSFHTTYSRALMTLTYRYHIRGWGTDDLRLEGGMLFSGSKAMPRSFLMAGNGIRMRGINMYAPGGLITMQPFDYYSDRFASLLLRHDFDKYLWTLKWSKPSISVAHNMVFGSLSDASKKAGNLRTYDADGYHESGMMLNQLLRKNFHIADLQLGGGAFFHWGQPDAFEKPVWVVSMGMTF